MPEDGNETYLVTINDGGIPCLRVANLRGFGARPSIKWVFILEGDGLAYDKEMEYLAWWDEPLPKEFRPDDWDFHKPPRTEYTIRIYNDGEEDVIRKLWEQDYEERDYIVKLIREDIKKNGFKPPITDKDFE